MMEPDGSKAVRLVDHREGQCRSITCYEDGELGRAMYCGHPTATKIIEGRAVPSSWCPYHRELYTAPPGGRVNLFVPRRFQSSPSPPKPPKTVATVARTCSECRAAFHTAYRMQMTCSPGCSQKRRTERSREAVRVRMASNPQYREQQRQNVKAWRERQRAGATAASS